MELSDYRAQIDRIDAELLQLFAERMQTAAGTGRACSFLYAAIPAAVCIRSANSCRSSASIRSICDL